MTRLTTGSLKNWTASLLRWRVPPVAYLLALVAIPAAVIAVLAILPGETAGGPELTGPALVIAPLVMGGVAYLIGGPLQEEVGWRGFALPRSQERTSPVPAAVILGIVWGGWHLPQFLIVEWETPHRDVGDLLAFLAFTVAASIVLSWITNTARGSVLLAILAHNAIERVGEGDGSEGDEPVAGGAGAGRSGGDRRRRDPGSAGIPEFSVIPESGNGHAPETGSHPHGPGMHVQDDAPAETVADSVPEFLQVREVFRSRCLDGLDLQSPVVCLACFASPRRRGASCGVPGCALGVICTRGIVVLLVKRIGSGGSPTTRPGSSSRGRPAPSAGSGS